MKSYEKLNASEKLLYNYMLGCGELISLCAFDLAEQLDWNVALVRSTLSSLRKNGYVTWERSTENGKLVLWKAHSQQLLNPQPAPRVSTKTRKDKKVMSFPDMIEVLKADAMSLYEKAEAMQEVYQASLKIVEKEAREYYERKFENEVRYTSQQTVIKPWERR